MAPGDDDEAAAASPEPEPEVEKEAEVTELKSETMLETQTDSADDQTEKSPAAAPPTAELAAVPAEPAPAAPEENRVGVNDASLTVCLLEIRLSTAGGVEGQ